MECRVQGLRGSGPIRVAPYVASQRAAPGNGGSPASFFEVLAVREALFFSFSFFRSGFGKFEVWESGGFRFEEVRVLAGFMGKSTGLALNRVGPSTILSTWPCIFGDL